MAQPVFHDVIRGMANRPVVLIADDDSQMRSFLANLFEVHGGFRIGGVAQDGFEAAMLAIDVKPDVVIMDFYMPRWDGARAARFIREHSPKTKIIAYSAILTEPPEWGDDFLLKNITNEVIPKTLRLCSAAPLATGT
ncbi:MAG: response regulator transcription factor [Actinomycetota bacterium]